MVRVIMREFFAMGVSPCSSGEAKHVQLTVRTASNEHLVSSGQISSAEDMGGWIPVFTKLSQKRIYIQFNP